jgi:hypothetical protein
MILPVAVLPVKFTFLTKGCSMIAFATAAASSVRWYITLNTPSGRPASFITLPKAQNVLGHNSEPFNMTVFPAAIAYKKALNPRIIGAFLPMHQLLSLTILHQS